MGLLEHSSLEELDPRSRRRQVVADVDPEPKL